MCTLKRYTGLWYMQSTSVVTRGRPSWTSQSPSPLVNIWESTAVMPWMGSRCMLPSERGVLSLFCSANIRACFRERSVVWFRSTDNNRAQQQERYICSMLQVSASARSAFMSDTRETGTFLRMMSVLKGLRQIPILWTGNTDRLHEVRS